MRSRTAIETTELRSEYYAVECDLSGIGVGPVRVVIDVDCGEPAFADGQGIARILGSTSDAAALRDTAARLIAPVMERRLIAWDWPEGVPCAGEKKSDFIALCGVPLWNVARSLAQGESAESVTRREQAMGTLVKGVRPVAAWPGMH